MSDFFMVRILGRVVERFGTQIALERTFAGMRTYVIDERSANFELFRTHVAAVRVEIVMESFVRYKRVSGDEGFAADFARERTFACMNTSMLFAGLFGVKALAANVALVVTNIQMDIFDVRVELVLSFRLLAA